MAIYRAEFVLVNSSNSEKQAHNDLSDTGSQKKTEVKSTDSIVGKQNENKKQNLSGVKKAVGVAIATSKFVYNYAVNEQLTSLSIQGDSIAARNLQNQKAITNELLSVGGTLISGALIGGPVGLAVASVAVATNYAIKAIDYSREVREYDANVQIDKYLCEQEQAKIQTNSKEFR